MDKLSKRKRSDEVAGFLRGKIYDGEYEAGEHLIELDIAKKLGISRGPVREALKILEYEGLVTYETNKGCTIAQLSGEDAYEIFYLRGMLEKVALEQCGGRFPDNSIFVMMNIVEDMKRLEKAHNKLQDIVACDERFHEEIVKAGRMNRLLNLWKTLSPLNGAMFLKVEQSYKFRAEAMMYDKGLPIDRVRKRNWESHREMLEIFKQGNLQRDLEILDNHYLETGEMIYRWEQRRQSQVR